MDANEQADTLRHRCQRCGKYSDERLTHAIVFVAADEETKTATFCEDCSHAVRVTLNQLFPAREAALKEARNSA